ncbi:alpha/beta hydrolase family protein [Rhodopirellula sp. P2]|uniref:alpha/beta hydrolase family protein n=1 Tax=Rhodopirellula sp. P2 TaxID=2127060 RepID=UPI002367EED9|nr:hypothetical protein [Rhodopirellula sp. P2]WDQ14648.1 hypothetical protein PSR62_13440 [Rhodopirellula sp. P2]
MSPRLFAFCLLLLRLATSTTAESPLPVDSNSILRTPTVTNGEPQPGKRVSVTPIEYAGTDVHHTVYLPNDWTADGESLPIIFEYTGNHYPASGSTGEVADAGLGFGLSAGQFIWVTLPFIGHDRQRNQITWWGDEEATVEYAKVNVPRILRQFSANPDRVFLCGFSRGAIAVNYIGLHDDEIANLWTAFVTHDHFDGVRAWKGTDWGSPLANYQSEASQRLKRVRDRPYLVCQNGSYATQEFVGDVLPNARNFTYLSVKTTEALGPFPNEFAKAVHNDRWLNRPSRYRSAAWDWMNQVLSDPTNLTSK